jgi:hypothetical protein
VGVVFVCCWVEEGHENRIKQGTDEGQSIVETFVRLSCTWMRVNSPTNLKRRRRWKSLRVRAIRITSRKRTVSLTVRSDG